MSRTYRNKHAEVNQGRNVWTWSKQYGWYGEREWNQDREYVWTMPDPRSLFRKWYRHHGDKKTYERPPCKWHRKQTNRNEKNDYKRQFNRWLHNAEFEIVNNDKMHRDNWGYY